MKARIKVILGLGALLLAALIAADQVWSHRRDEQGGYEAAGLRPIDGARLISVNRGGETIRGGVTVWIYQLPHDYFQNLYKDCSRIGYKQGIHLELIKDGVNVNSSLGPGHTGCFVDKSSRTDTIFVQFLDDKLIVQDAF